jgi:hypothetical protein
MSRVDEVGLRASNGNGPQTAPNKKLLDLRVDTRASSRVFRSGNRSKVNFMQIDFD